MVSNSCRCFEYKEPDPCDVKQNIFCATVLKVLHVMNKSTAAVTSLPSRETKAQSLLAIIARDYENRTLPSLGSSLRASSTGPEKDTHDSARDWLAILMHSIKKATLRMRLPAFPEWESLETREQTTVKMCAKLEKELRLLSLWIHD